MSSSPASRISSASPGSPASRPTLLRSAQPSDSPWPVLAIGALVGMMACFAASVYGLFTAGAPVADTTGVMALGIQMGAVSAWSLWALNRGRQAKAGAARLVSGALTCYIILGPFQVGAPRHVVTAAVLEACWFPLLWGAALCVSGLRLCCKSS